MYQGLSNKYSAIETPTWALLLAESCRAINLNVSIIDTLAENLSDSQTLERLKKNTTKAIIFVVYGQNVNAGTTNMSGAIRLSKLIKKNLSTRICFIGSHVQALPVQTLQEQESIDIAFRNSSTNKIEINPPEKGVPQDKIDIDLPGYAWDLLPYKNTPFDLYRAPMWHSEYKEENRTPYAAIQTSLGCQFGCNFCMINIINRDDNDPIGVAGNYSKMRFWSTDFIIKEFDKLFSYGVKTIKITDEMFLLNPKYYKPLCEKLAERNTEDKFKIWAYSRIDTVKRPEILNLVQNFIKKNMA